MMFRLWICETQIIHQILTSYLRFGVCYLLLDVYLCLFLINTSEKLE